uniref:Uncharacterized protein n=1 Tax=Tanacetum cinerariifolium TaxID=118510 RepID=A0A699KHB8_TANCI|nr:hypothetical protein [Tanacetum cinerariifolium]
MSTSKFAETHNLVVFLKKPTESKGFEQIVDFLNIRALVDGKKVIVNKASIRRDLRLDDAKGTTCLPNAAIFEELTRMSAKTTAWNKFSSTMASAIICLANNKKFNFSKYILNNMVKNLEAEVKFYMIPIFVQVFMNHQFGDMSHHKGIFVNLSLTKRVFANMKRVATGFSGRKHKSRRKQMKETEVPHTKLQTKEHIPTPSYDPLPSGEDRMQLYELMEICTTLSDRVLSLEQIKTNQTAKIKKLKRRVKKLEGNKKKRTHEIKRLYKVRLSAIVESFEEEEAKIKKLKRRVKKLEGNKKKRTHEIKRLYKVRLSAIVESFEEEEGLGDQENASKQERIAEIDADEDL